MKILIACFIISIANAHISIFHIPVLEKGAFFKQVIKTNLIDDTVEFHTPAHNDILETFKLQDFRDCKHFACLKSKNVSHLNKSHYPNAGNMMEGFAHVWNNGLSWMISQNTQTFSQRWIKTNTVVPKTSQVVNNFLAFHGYPAYKLEQVPNDAILLQDVQQRRRDDFLPADRQCSPGERPIRRYGYTKTGGCDHLYFCPTTTSTSPSEVTTRTGCSEKHIIDQIFFSCLCCPDAHTKHDCLYCAEVKK